MLRHANKLFFLTKSNFNFPWRACKFNLLSVLDGQKWLLHMWLHSQDHRVSLSKWQQWKHRCGSRILVRGGPVEFWPQGALSPKFAQNRGFALKIAYKWHDFEFFLAPRGDHHWICWWSSIDFLLSGDNCVCLTTRLHSDFSKFFLLATTDNCPCVITRFWTVEKQFFCLGESLVSDCLLSVLTPEPTQPVCPTDLLFRGSGEQRLCDECVLKQRSWNKIDLLISLKCSISVTKQFQANLQLYPAHFVCLSLNYPEVFVPHHKVFRIFLPFVAWTEKVETFYILFNLKWISLYTWAKSQHMHIAAGIHSTTVSTKVSQILTVSSTASVSFRLSTIAPLIKFIRPTTKDPKREKSHALLTKEPLIGCKVLWMKKNDKVRFTIAISLKIRFEIKTKTMTRTSLLVNRMPFQENDTLLEK